jgi:hypothetical protein
MLLKKEKRGREQGIRQRKKLFYKNEYQPVSVKGMVELEGCHFVTLNGKANVITDVIWKEYTTLTV